jgi:hypothetical protein
MLSKEVSDKPSSYVAMNEVSDAGHLAKYCFLFQLLFLSTVVGSQSVEVKPRKSSP